MSFCAWLPGQEGVHLYRQIEPKVSFANDSTMAMKNIMFAQNDQGCHTPGVGQPDNADVDSIRLAFSRTLLPVQHVYLCRMPNPPLTLFFGAHCLYSSCCDWQNQLQNECVLPSNLHACIQLQAFERTIELWH